MHSTMYQCRSSKSLRQWRKGGFTLLAQCVYCSAIWRAAYGGKNFPLYNFCNEEWSVSFFQQTMSKNRCREIIRFLRFDLRSTKSARWQTDKFALISDIWFVDNSISCYQPGENITIYEKLFPTKSRCRFIQYMPNKPDKFSMKFWLAVDVEFKYILNAIPYLGKDESRPSTQRLSYWQDCHDSHGTIHE